MSDKDTKKQVDDQEVEVEEVEEEVGAEDELVMESEELVEGESAGEVNRAGLDADSFNATKNLVQNLSIKIDELKAKQKELKDRMRNLLDNDVLLNEFEEKAKDATVDFKKRKRELLESVEAKEVQAKLKELGEELGDMQDSLTNHLLTYFQVTGTQSFETVTGQEREFKLQARLLPLKTQ